MHLEHKQTADDEKIINEVNQIVAHTSGWSEKRVLLRVAPVTIRNDSKEMKIYALFDEASTVTLIDESLADEMNMKGSEVNLGLTWTNKDSRQQFKSLKVSFDIYGQDGVLYKLNNVYTMQNLELPMQTVNAKRLKSQWRHLQNIDFSSYFDKRPQLLIGQDNWELITTREIIEGPKNAPALSRTKLGWVLHGNIHFQGRVDNTVLHVGTTQDHVDELHNLVKSFFTIESLGVKDSKKIISKKDERAEELMEKLTKRINDRWETGLLWKDVQDFPDTYAMAVKRLEFIERKMDKNINFAKAYRGKVEEYLDKGYARLVPKEEVEQNTEKVWYIPHFAVTNPNKSGKIRFVFDAAAKVNSKSLNDFLLKGPDLFNSLVGILFKFRQKPIAFSADIREMFHQIRIRKEDQSGQRFLWRENKDQEPTVYAMEAMIFGAVPSPYSAQYAKNRNALDFKENFPEAVEAIIKRHYMDDYLDSANSPEEAIKLVKDVIYIHSKGGFEIRSWASNSEE